MQTRLAVEKYDISIDNMPLDDIADCEPVRNRIPIPKTQKFFIFPSRDKVGAWMNVWPIPDRLLQSMNIVSCYALRIC
jgi:hypothetical protein